MKIIQICASDNCIYALTEDGKIYVKIRNNDGWFLVPFKK